MPPADLAVVGITNAAGRTTAVWCSPLRRLEAAIGDRRHRLAACGARASKSSNIIGASGVPGAVEPEFSGEVSDFWIVNGPFYHRTPTFRRNERGGGVPTIDRLVVQYVGTDRIYNAPHLSTATGGGLGRPTALHHGLGEVGKQHTGARVPGHLRPPNAETGAHA